MVLSCSVLNCSSKHCKDRSFYRFPRDPTRCKLWVDATGRPELWEMGVETLHKNHHVCDLHFRQSDRLIRKLKAYAVPLPHDLEPHIMVPLVKINKFTQTVPVEEEGLVNKDVRLDIDNGPSTSNIKKVSVKTKRSPTQKRVKGGQALACPSGNYYIGTPELQKLVDLQNRLKNAMEDERRENDLKPFYLHLFLSHPKTYRVIRNTLNLPAEETFRRFNIQFDSFISPDVERYLESKMKSLKESEKYCTISVSKMYLKKFLFYHIDQDIIIGFHDIGGQQYLEPATTAYVIMARGITLKWEQPLSYCFFAKNKAFQEIETWLERVISKVMHIGFNVVALVSDHEDLDFYNLAKIRNVSFSHPYFCINGKNIYNIFDVPQLIKSLRNTLMIHDFEFKDSDGMKMKASWRYIESLYLGQSEHKNCPHASKLTESHIRPNQFEKKDLKYAAQIFSKSVSDDLELEAKKRAEWQNAEVRGTQRLTSLVNNAFDILNAGVNHDNQSKNTFTGDKFQMATIKTFMEFLSGVTVKDELDYNITDSVHCFDALKISIVSISSILRDLACEGVHSLLTHRFNLSYLDRFFDSVKEKAKFKTPTPIEFWIAFRKLFIAELLKCPKTASRSDDLNQLLMNADVHSFDKHLQDTASRKIAVGTVDYRYDLPNTDTFLYVCSYLLRKCYEIHKCGAMNQYVHSSARNIDWNNYDVKFTSKPPDTFVEFIKTMDECFNCCFENNMKIGVANGLLMELRDLTLDSVCHCFPMIYLKKLFVRQRIFNVIQYNNRRLRDKSLNVSDVIVKGVLFRA